MSVQTQTRSRRWLRRIAIAVLAIVLLLAGVYWYVATDKFADTKQRKADYSLTAMGFIGEFKKNIDSANKKYTDKIVELNGRVSAVEAADTTLNVKFIDPATSSYIIFAFQQQHLGEAKTLHEGDSISIKGSCSGGIYSEILDATAISFKRAALNK